MRTWAQMLNPYSNIIKQIFLKLTTHNSIYLLELSKRSYIPINKLIIKYV